MKNKIKFKRKYRVNEDYFKKWSPDMAYIFGFWFADGCITRNTFKISQHEKDRYILEQIASKMKYGGKLKRERANCSLEINSKIMVGDIIRLGGRYRKSLVCRLPRVPKKYLPHFIRGVWDGDGSIETSRKVASVGSGSEAFIDDISAVLKNIGINGCKIITSQKKGTVILGSVLKTYSFYYRISLCKNDTRRLRNYMYRSSCRLRLIRKWKLFKDAGEINIKNFMRFKEARQFVRGLNLKSNTAWKKYIKRQSFPKRLPKDPAVTYREKGWKNWYDFLGNKRAEYLPYKEAKQYVNKIGLGSHKEWRDYLKNQNRPKNIPYKPNKIYKCAGWVDWYDWLGKNRDKIKN